MAHRPKPPATIKPGDEVQVVVKAVNVLLIKQYSSGVAREGGAPSQIGAARNLRRASSHGASSALRCKSR